MNVLITRFILPVVVLLTISTSCNVEQIEKYNSDFEGKWRTEPYNAPTVGGMVRNYIIINGKDSGLGIACKTNCELCDCLVFQAGRVKIHTSTKELQVGGTVNQIMRVDEEPFINNEGTWEFIMNDLSYLKYE